MKKHILILAFAAAASISANAQIGYMNSKFNPIHTALVSQGISPDARAAGMGEIGAATDPDVNSQYWNPAKYPFCISRAGVALNYTPWLRQLVPDMDIAYLAGYYRIGDYSAISGSLRYFSLGDVYTSYDENDLSNAMTIRPYEMSLDVAYSLMLSESFSIAAGVRYLLSDMSFSDTEEKTTSGAFAADLSCYYQSYPYLGNRECQLGLGMSISNIGSKITLSGTDYSEFIPTNLRLGASLMIPVNDYNRITFAADANKLLVPSYPQQKYDPNNEEWASTNYVEPEELYQQRLQKDYYELSSISGMFKSFSDAPGGMKEEMDEIQWSIGAEYCYNDQFFLRGGYHHEAETKGNRKYYTLGAGFHMSAFTLDAAYCIATAQSNPLDQTLRFSLSFDLDGIKDLFNR